MIITARLKFDQGDDTTDITDAIRADREFMHEGFRWYATSIRSLRDGSLAIDARCLGKA